MSTTLEAVASYQRCGDGPADVWARTVLDYHQREGLILGGSVLGEWQAGWVQVVVFTFQFAVTSDQLQYPLAETLATNLAEAIVGESDVVVIGLKHVEPAIRHRHRFDFEVNAWWCDDCAKVTEHCSQLHPAVVSEAVANVNESSRNQEAPGA